VDVLCNFALTGVKELIEGTRTRATGSERGEAKRKLEKSFRLERSFCAASEFLGEESRRLQKTKGGHTSTGDIEVAVVIVDMIEVHIELGAIFELT